MNASALVVGIDDYRAAPKLSGAVDDAIEVTRWLLSIGVAAHRIRLHIAPVVASPDPQVVIRDPTREKIWDSVCDIAQESGDRLFVFLSGHGLYIPGEGAAFLTQEFDDLRRLDANLGVLAFADYFRSLPFDDQILVCDACQNLSNPATQRARIPPNGPGAGGWTPQSTTGLTLCQATSQGQFAYLVNGRGLLTRRLLTALIDGAAHNIPRGGEDAIVHDWKTGDQLLDLRPLFQVVRADVEAAAASQGSQTPTLQPHGRATAENRTIVQSLDAGTLETVSIDVVSGGLDELRLGLRPPVKELRVPAAGYAPPFPFDVKVPQGAGLRAYCEPEPGWDAAPASISDTIQAGGTTLRFVLSRPPPPPAGGGADEAHQFNVRIIDSTGGDAWPLRDEHYDAVERLPGMRPEPGFSILRHESGPDIEFPKSDRARAAAFARDWRDSINEILRPRRSGYEAYVIPAGTRVAASRPNVRILLPEGGAEQIAGFISKSVGLNCERAGGSAKSDTRTIPLGRLEQRSLLRFAPGLWRIALNLPWGSWSTTMDVNEDLVTVDLPAKVGREPLRKWARELGIVWDGHGLGFIQGDERPLFVEARQALNGLPLEMWRMGERYFVVPFISDDHSGHHVERLVGRIDNGALQVEPLSSIGWPEWDLLIGAGRLESVDLPVVLKRLDDFGSVDSIDATGLLRVALAYSAYAQSDHLSLRRLMAIIPETLAGLTDVLALRASVRPDVPSERSVLSAPGLGFPVFRWGIPLMQRLYGDAAADFRPLPTSNWTVLEVAAGYSGNINVDRQSGQSDLQTVPAFEAV